MGGSPFALDFGAVMLMGQARRVDIELLSRVLPHVEAAILIGREASSLEGEDD